MVASNDNTPDLLQFVDHFVSHWFSAILHKDSIFELCWVDIW